jgi:osmotically-inducible protein OsmY
MLFFEEKGRNMFSDNQMSDKELLRTVSRRLQRGGGGGVAVDVQRGTVTLRGKVRYEAQRRPILKIVNSIAGVRRVIDQLQLQPIRPG